MHSAHPEYPDFGEITLKEFTEKVGGRWICGGLPPTDRPIFWVKMKENWAAELVLWSFPFRALAICTRFLRAAFFGPLWFEENEKEATPSYHQHWRDNLICPRKLVSGRSPVFFGSFVGWIFVPDMFEQCKMHKPVDGFSTGSPKDNWSPDEVQYETTLSKKQTKQKTPVEKRGQDTRD